MEWRSPMWRSSGSSHSTSLPVIDGGSFHADPQKCKTLWNPGSHARLGFPSLWRSLTCSFPFPPPLGRPSRNTSPVPCTTDGRSASWASCPSVRNWPSTEGNPGFLLKLPEIQSLGEAFPSQDLLDSPHIGLIRIFTGSRLHSDVETRHPAWCGKSRFFRNDFGIVRHDARISLRPIPLQNPIKAILRF